MQSINELDAQSQQSEDSMSDEVQSNVLGIENQGNFLFQHKVSTKGRYYTICTIHCPDKPEFVSVPEKTLLNIDDTDNPDYWTMEDSNKPSLLSIVPRCCLSMTDNDLQISSTYGKKRNPREVFREEILQISNKNQESLMKRKYAVVDMVECDREYCASLRLIRDILSSLDTTGNQFSKEIILLFSDLQELVARLVEIHEKQILPKLSTSTLSPANVAIVLLEEKESLKIYSELTNQWKILKVELDKFPEKHILLKDNSTYDNSKISMTTFSDMIHNIDGKLLQYSTFLFDILIYTGRIGGDIYDIQRAITMICRIKRFSYEEEFLKNLITDNEFCIKNERIIRTTENIIVSGASMTTKNGKILKLLYSKNLDICLLKMKLILIEKESLCMKIFKIIDISKIKILETENENGKLILWVQLPDESFEIYSIIFQSLISQRTWIYDLKRRFVKLGKTDIFVSSDDFENQYRKFVLNCQRLVAIEMESVPMESSIIDDSCTAELYEEMTSSIDSSSDVNYESAVMDTPSPLTSTSYNTALDKLKTSTDKATRPLSGISQDSISTLDGVQTPFEDEDQTRAVTIISHISNISIDKDKDLSWSLTLNNFEKQSHTIVWSICGKILDPKDPEVSVKITEVTNKVYQCQFIKKNNPQQQTGQVTCKIVDTINGILLASVSANLQLPIAPTEIELDSKLTEITVKENERIDIVLKVTFKSSPTVNVNYLVWSKDNEAIKLDQIRTTSFFDDKENTIVLRILKANNSDAGIYTIESCNNNMLLIKNSSSISILVLIEMVKKIVYRAASQEDKTQFEQAEISDISPLNRGETITGFSNENTSNDTYHSVVTTTKINDLITPILKATSTCVQGSELNEVTIEVAILGQVKDDPKWYFEKKRIENSDNIKSIYDPDKKIAQLIIKKCEMDHRGNYRCTVLSFESDTEEFVNIELKVNNMSSCIECDVQEIDLKSGEMLKLDLKAVGIEDSILKEGSWYLNSKPLDLKKINGEFTVSKCLISLKIKEVSKVIEGVLQFKIMKPINKLSPQIDIKIRDAVKKSPKANKDDLQLKALKSIVEVLENKEILLEIEIISGNLAMYQAPKWTLNDVNIVNRNCKTTSDSKSCKLSLSLCKIKDSGNYKCSFLPAKGKRVEPVTMTFTVTVKDQKAISTDTKIKELVTPIIKIKTPLIEVDEFSELVLGADLLGKINGDPRWYFNNIMLEKAENMEFNYSIEKGFSQVIIRKCEKSHEGDYKCTVINSGNEKEESVNVVVKVVQKQKTGFLDCEIQEIDLKCGEILKLEMKAMGIDQSDLNDGKWFLNSKLLDLRTVNADVTVSNNLLILRIPDVTKAIQGILQCKLANISSPEIEIKIREAEKKSPKSNKDDLNLKAKKPTVEVMENKEILLEIEIISGNLAMYQAPKWTLNDVNIVNRNCKTTSDSKSCKLSLSTCKLKDSGNYKCSFLPAKGKRVEPVTMTFTVTVKDQKAISTDTKNKELVTPIIKIKTPLIEVDEFSDLFLGADLLGKINGDPRWYFNNIMLEKAENMEFNYSIEKGFSQVIIKKCEKAHEGDYICTVINSGNEKEESVNAVVKVVQKQKTGFLDCEIQEIDLKCGEILKLEMNAVGIDESDLKGGKWFLNSKLLDLKKLKGEFTVAKGMLSLKISEVTKSLQGILQFKIDKPTSLSSPDIEIKVRDADKSLSETKKVELKIKEDEDICGKMIVSNTVIDAVEGDSVTLCVETEGFVEKDIKWTLSDDRKLSDERITEKFNNNLALLLIDKINRTDSGVYICKGFRDKEVLSEVSMTLTVSPKEIKCSNSFEHDSYVAREGSDITMKVANQCQCRQAAPKWYFNGKSFEIGTETVSNLNDSKNSVELTLKNCGRDKAGIYQYTVEHKDGSTSTSETMLMVIDLLEQRTVKLQEGEKLNLEATSDSDPKQRSFQWSKNGIILDESLGFNQSFEGNMFRLFREKSTMDDTGRYILSFFQNAILERAIEFNVTVESLRNRTNFEKIKLICDDQNVVANENEPLIISVEVDKWQPATVQWFLNGTPFGDCQELDHQFIDLFIDSPKPRIHSGLFKCVVTDERGSTSEVDIVVRFEDVKGNVDEEIELLCCTVEEVDLIEGSQLQLSVASRESTKSKPIFSWYKDEKPLVLDDSRLHFAVQNFHYNLILNNVKKSDSGIYCLKVDGNSVAINVRVRMRPVEIETKNAFSRFGAPITKLKMKEIMLKNELQVVKFEFEVQQCGPTKAVWFFEDEQIEVENSEFIQWSCDNYFALTIPAASVKHCGRYTIKVANEMGYVKDEAQLCFVEKTKKSTFTQEMPENIEESCCIAPMFTKKMKSIDLSSGDILRLSCRVMSEPEPKILWTKDGESLDPKNSNRKMRILNNFPNYDLTISDISSKDIGQYCCMASNFLGFDTTIAMVTIDGNDFNYEDDLNNMSGKSRVLGKPLNAPFLKIISTSNSEVQLQWTEVITTDHSAVTYSIEKQKFNKSNQWKILKKDLTTTSYTISVNDLPLTESHHLRCVATTEFGYQAESNLLSIDARVKPPTIPAVKPNVVFNDATCTTISWQRGKCHGMTSEESFGKVFYCLEMKDNTKSDWQIVDNKIVKSEFTMSLEPGVSYMFRVSATNDEGKSEPTPGVVARIDQIKLVPELSDDAPWLHLQGQQCLKWCAARVPEFCDACLPGIAPEYVVEYRIGRSTPWKIVKENITQNQIFIGSDILSQAKEFRVSCGNRFGKSGPTKSYRVPANVVRKADDDSKNCNKTLNVINAESLKNMEIDSISPSGISLKWDSWCDQSNHRYILQKKSTYSSDWINVESVIYGEDFFLDLKLPENFSRELRLLAFEDDGRLLVQGYNQVMIPSKEELIPNIPQDLKVSATLTIHELSWSPSKNHPFVDLPITYLVQYRISNNLWITASDSLKKCSYSNDKIGEVSAIFYRVSASNAFGSSQYGAEIQVNTPLNVILNEQIVKSVRYFVIDSKRLDLKWQLSDVVFDNGLNIDVLSFIVERKCSTELSDWTTVGRCTGRCSVLVGFKFDEEYLYRVQPYIGKEKMAPSRMIRISLSKELLVPDMSFIKPVIISDSITDYSIEWIEPSIEGGFSPEGLNMCSISVLMADLQYALQYCSEISATLRGSLTKFSPSCKWKTIEENIYENTFYWENPDPTQEYSFRVIPFNQFGEGQPSRVIKLRPQISIPDFSLVRLNIDIQPLGTKSTEYDTVLSWIAPKINPERYTPYTLDVQYRLKGPSSEDKWVTLKSSLKKSRVSINELDPKIDYDLRIVPITEFGSGNPSVVIKRSKYCDKDQSTNMRSQEINFPNYNACKDVYVSLSSDTALNFSNVSNIEKDDVIWMKDGQRMVLNDDRLKVFYPDRCSACLLISCVKEEDIGTYNICSKTNEILQSVKLIKADAPTILNPPQNISVNLHDNLQVTFKIDSQPLSTVLWSKNWKKIYSSYRATIDEDKDNGRYSLRLSKCILSDSGEYSVRAENVVGFVEVKFNLRVDDQPEMKVIQINEGEVIDRFFIVRQISRGSFSTCQMMAEKSSRREFVGKVFGLNNLEIGKKEFESLKNVRHRNIVELLDALSSYTDGLVLIYESFEGLLLVDHISSLSHWNEQSVQLIVHQLIRATCYLHTLGICHLDIQPCNVMVTGKFLDTIKLFGFSNASKEDDLENRRTQFTLSPFSSPELLKGEPLSLNSDVWSLGVLTLICLKGSLNMDLKKGPLGIDGGKGLLSDQCWMFVSSCLQVNSQTRLSSLEAQRHDWFTNTLIDYNASMDHLKDDIIKLMTYPEEMVLNFSADMQSAIKNSLIIPKPKLIVDSIQSSPSISQLSSRASSVSRDGINYERCDIVNEPIADTPMVYGDCKENFQSVDDTFVPNSARELLFTVPLKDQTFRPVSIGDGRNVVNLTCQLALSASDAISISWYKNQELLTDGSKIKLEVLSGGFLSCTIGNPTESDAGIYRCVARSRSLRAETAARLLVGDIPARPGQPSVLFVNDNDVLLKWTTCLAATDDIIYRVDFKEINNNSNWKTIGYTVDNQYLMENFTDSASITRVVAQNKYGFSSYSVASSAFQNTNSHEFPSGKVAIRNKHWMLSTRQSTEANNLHDLIKDIPSNEITMEVMENYYTNQSTVDRDVRVLTLNQVKGNYPDFVVQRINTTDKCAAIDLCLRMKYYHLPVIYGAVNEPSLGLRYTIEEFVPGGDLISVLLARAIYSEFTVVTILRQLMETVQFLHSNNIVHTNINPSNILIARRTNQLYDIKLISLHHCQSLDSSATSIPLQHKVAQKLSTFQAPEYRYEGITRNETDIWSIGTLAFLLLATQLPTIEDICSDSNVQCSIRNSNTLHLPTMHTHFRSPDLSMLGKFSKSARKFIYNSLKKNPIERGSADYWLAHSWFRQDLSSINEMQLRQIRASPLVEFMTPFV